jgi:hypothetical protein
VNRLTWLRDFCGCELFEWLNWLRDFKDCELIDQSHVMRLDCDLSNSWKTKHNRGSFHTEGCQERHLMFENCSLRRIAEFQRIETVLIRLDLDISLESTNHLSAEP